LLEERNRIVGEEWTYRRGEKENSFHFGGKVPKSGGRRLGSISEKEDEKNRDRKG